MPQEVQLSDDHSQVSLIANRTVFDAEETRIEGVDPLSVPDSMLKEVQFDIHGHALIVRSDSPVSVEELTPTEAQPVAPAVSVR